MLHRRALTVAITLVALAAQAAVPVRIEGDRLTVVARRTPLLEILEGFAHAGVNVRADPSLDVLVTGSCHEMPMEQALDALLEPYAYILVWNLVPGPVGDLPRLAEMQVFAPGQKHQLQPLPASTNRNFQVTRGTRTDGPLYVADEILVGVRGGVKVEDFRRLLAQIGGTVVDSVPALGIYRVRLLPGTNVDDLVAQLKRNPLLQEVEPNYAAVLPATPARGAGASAAVAPVPARGATPVAILDSGLLGGQGLDEAVIARYDAILPGSALEDPSGHGTQMALLAAGGVSPSGVEATAEGVPVVAVRAFDDRGTTSNFALMRALQYALEQGARVINLSWGSETRSAFVEAAVSYAQSRGAVVVAAAGNEPTGRPMYPAAYDGVVAVSALNEDQATTWDQSNYGDFVSVAAPGRATFPVGHDGPPGAYAGTSIASAYVARELALYFTRHPTATAADAIRALRAAATDAGAKGRDPRYGYGALDAAARQRLRAAP